MAKITSQDQVDKILGTIDKSGFKADVPINLSELVDIYYESWVCKNNVVGKLNSSIIKQSLDLIEHGRSITVILDMQISDVLFLKLVKEYKGFKLQKQNTDGGTVITIRVSNGNLRPYLLQN